MVAFLEPCREILRPGGRVVFAERVRVKAGGMAPRELTLNLSTYHRTAAIRNDCYRPTHAYLSPANWICALELAGFAKASIWPDLEALEEEFPEQYAAIVVGEA